MKTFWQNLWNFGAPSMLICIGIFAGWEMGFGQALQTDWSSITVSLGLDPLLADHLWNIPLTMFLVIWFAHLRTKTQTEPDYKNKLRGIFWFTFGVSAIFAWVFYGRSLNLFVAGTIFLFFGLIVSLITTTDRDIGEVAGGYVFFQKNGLWISGLLMLFLGWPAALISMSCFSLISFLWWLVKRPKARHLARSH